MDIDEDRLTYLRGLSDDEWVDEIQSIAREKGEFIPLGPDHFAIRFDRGNKLFVTFEHLPELRDRRRGELPLSWRMSANKDWSNLTIISRQDKSWFREEAIYNYFDDLIDSEFFEEFERTLFAGDGSAGYAAAAFSVAAPEARVLVIAPQATMLPSVAGWDKRYTQSRRLDFTSRYGYAPDMAAGAEAVWILYDPQVPEDTMHAQLFAGDNTQHLRTPNLGRNTMNQLMIIGILEDFIEEAMAGSLDQQSFTEIWRERHRSFHYLRLLMNGMERAKRPAFTALIARFGQAQNVSPFFERWLAEKDGSGAA